MTIKNSLDINLTLVLKRRHGFSNELSTDLAF